MSDYYKQPIAVFGFALPGLFMLLLAGVALYGNANISGTFDKKKRAYDKSQEASRQQMELLGKVNENKKLLSAWDNMLKTETRGTFLEHWKKAEDRFSGKELTKTSHNWLNYSDGLGRGISQPASQVNMSFQATYRAMQTSLMEIETTLPNMQLDGLEIKLDNSGAALNFETTFTVWTLK